jgi:subtilisin family serine protease
MKRLFYNERTFCKNKMSINNRKLALESLEDRIVLSISPMPNPDGLNLMEVELVAPPVTPLYPEINIQWDFSNVAERDIPMSTFNSISANLGDIQENALINPGANERSIYNAMTGISDVRNLYGLDGTGQTVVIIDSGIAYDHVALGGGFGTGYKIVGS